MPVANRRAPHRARRFAVLKTFRYMRRVFEVGDVFVPRGDVPRHRLDRLWREGCIGTTDGEQCPTPRRSEVTADEQREPSLMQLLALESMAEAHGVGDTSEASDEESEE